MTEVLKNNSKASRFEMDVDGKTVFANYKLDAPMLIVTHVEAPVELRGTGAAGRFMQKLAEHARAEKLKIVPICGYAATWLERHKEFKDLIA